MLGLASHHDAIDEDARNLHVLRLDRSLRDDALDLRDDDAAVVVRGHRLRQVVEQSAIPLHADVAERVGARAADERDVDRRRLVEQPLLAFDFDELDDVVRRDVVDLAAAESRIDVRMEADLGEKARADLMRRRDRAAR